MLRKLTFPSNPKLVFRYKILLLDNSYKFQFKSDIGMGMNWDPKPIKENVLRQCNLTLDDYIKKNKWVGTGSTNCSDPKILQSQITVGVEDMRIKKVIIETFDQNTFQMYPNDSTLQWTKVSMNANITCNTLTLPDKLKEKGIYTIYLDFDDWPDLSIHVHQQGLLFTDMPDSTPYLSDAGIGHSVPVLHEIVQLKKYNGKMCNDSLNYRLDECRLDYIKKVSLTN